MSDKKHVGWLYEQLPDLVGRGVLTRETADRLRQHYGEAQHAGRRWAVTAFAVLGAALIGAGIISLLAHNWEELSRPVRAVISFVPLVLAQLVAGYVLMRRPESAAWREGAGAFWTVAIGSSIALIAQTYNLGGDFGDFMLTWVLLALPVAYLLRATLPAILYLIGILFWTGAMWHSAGKELGYWLLLALVLPWWWREARADRFQNRLVWFGWTLTITLPIGFGMSLHTALREVWPLFFSALAGVVFLAGCRWWDEAGAVWRRPFQTMGAVDAVGLALLFSFQDMWKEVSWSAATTQGWPVALAWGIGAVWMVAAVGLWVESLRSRDPGRIFLGAIPVVMTLGYVLPDFAAMLLVNAYLLALGIGILASGVRQVRLGLVNAGMLLLSALVVCRFFDADIGFVVRGLVFIALGAGFLVTNIVLLRRKAAVAS